MRSINIRGDIYYDEPMSRHTSLKVGGNADIFAVPADRDDLVKLVEQLVEAGIDWMTVGRGYNLLVGDKGIDGAVISLLKLNNISLLSAGKFLVEAGVENLEFVRYAQRVGRGGLSFISGIPGSIGGGIKMNAGAYGGGIINHIESITILSADKITVAPKEELSYGYRHLHLKGDEIIVDAIFNLEEYDQEKTEEEITKDLDLRRRKHNVRFPSAGSFFKNPKDNLAWRLIDNAGMRGVSVGGAMVSDVHSNFLVNCGGATAADFVELSNQIKNAVFQTSGMTLEEEVRIVGKF